MKQQHRTVTGPEVPDPTPSATAEDPPAKATTTSEEDKHSAGQRAVNRLWELMQAMIAAATVTSALGAAIYTTVLGVQPGASDRVVAAAVPAFLLLSNMASLVIGFYFGRTNHQNVGGVQLGR